MPVITCSYFEPGDASPRSTPAEILRVGQMIEVVQRTTAEEVEAFAEMTGDRDAIHLDEDYCRRTPYGRRIVHGALILAQMSASSWLATRALARPAVTVGYDRLRFILPVFLDEAVRIRWEVMTFGEENGRVDAQVTVQKEDGELAATALHLLKLF